MLRIGTNGNTPQQQGSRNADETAPLLIGRQVQHADGQLRSERRERVATLSILCFELLERFAFYGVAANLVGTLNRNPLNWISYSALSASFLLSGVAYALALFGGWLSDAWLGSFKACVLAVAFYLPGLLLWPMLFALPLRRNESASSLPIICTELNNSWYPLQPAASFTDWRWPDSDSLFSQNCASIITASLCCVAIGSGLLKANLSPFGASQISDVNKQIRFFNWFYWACNVGSFLAYFLLTYAQQNMGVRGLLIGYSAPPIALAIGAIVFSVSRPAYRVRQPSGSVLSSVLRLLVAACRNCRRQRRQQQQQQQQLYSVSHSGFLDYARMGGAFTEAEVQDTRALLKVALIFGSLLPYWLLYFQMQTTYLIQGLHMRLAMGDFLENIPPAWLSLCDIAVIIVLIPFLTKCVLPRLRARGWQPSLAAQITAGMCMALLSVTCAGLLESWRLRVLWGTNATSMTPERAVNQQIGDTIYQAADLSILYQVPQYCLMGVGEAFMSIACLRLAFQGAPRSMKSLITGMFWFSCGCASLCGVGLVSLLTDRLWFFSIDRGNPNCRIACPTDPSKVCHECHLDFYFYSLACVQLCGLLLFGAVCRRYYSSQYSTGAASPFPSQGLLWQQQQQQQPLMQQRQQRQQQQLAAASLRINRDGQSP